MNYEQEYIKTVEQLYLVEEQLTGYRDREEKLDMLFRVRDLIDRLIADRKHGVETCEEVVLQSLVGIFNRYGEFYFSELLARRELKVKDVDLLAAQEMILAQKEEIEKMKQSLEFLKTE